METTEEAGLFFAVRATFRFDMTFWWFLKVWGIDGGLADDWFRLVVLGVGLLDPKRLDFIVNLFGLLGLGISPVPFCSHGTRGSNIVES